MQQGHTGFLQGSAAFTMIAGRTGGDQVGPTVLSAQMLGQHMVDGEEDRVLATILAGEMIPPENFTPAQTDLDMRAVDHVLQANDRGDRVGGSGSFNDTASIENESGFFRQH